MLNIKIFMMNKYYFFKDLAKMSSISKNVNIFENNNISNN